MAAKSKKSKKSTRPKPPFHFDCPIENLFRTIINAGPDVVLEVLAILKKEKKTTSFDLCTISDTSTEGSYISYLDIEVEEGKCYISHHFFSCFEIILQELSIFYFVLTTEGKEKKSVACDGLDIAILNELVLLLSRMMGKQEYEKCAHFRDILYKEAWRVKANIRKMNAHIFPGKD